MNNGEGAMVDGNSLRTKYCTEQGKTEILHMAVDQ